MKRTRRKPLLNSAAERRPILRIPEGFRSAAIHSIHTTVEKLEAAAKAHSNPVPFEIVEAWLTDVFEYALDEAATARE